MLGMPLLVREVPVRGNPRATQGLALAATNDPLLLNEYPKTNLDVTNQLRFGLSEPGRFQLYREWSSAVSRNDENSNPMPHTDSDHEGIVIAILLDGKGGARKVGWHEVEAWKPDARGALASTRPTSPRARPG